MSEIADDFPDRADALDYEPDIDYPNPAEELAAEDAAEAAYFTRQAEDAADAYAALRGGMTINVRTDTVKEPDDH